MEQNFKIAVPEGCTAEIKQENGFIVVNFKPDKWEPKDGDVIAFGTKGIGIFKTYCSTGHEEYVAFVDKLRFGESGWVNHNMRPATEEEKQRLFDALSKEGKRWNAEEKRIEDLPRWRANLGDFYFYVNETLGVDNHAETKDGIDNSFYTSGNYFKTHEAAEKVAKQIRESLRTRKQNKLLHKCFMVLFV